MFALNCYITILKHTKILLASKGLSGNYVYPGKMVCPSLQSRMRVRSLLSPILKVVK